MGAMLGCRRRLKWVVVGARVKRPLRGVSTGLYLA